ncbi:MAG: DNA adenine methylase [Methanomicrobiales archaeon]|nr:DNA adenine methylase [Methanomicrobiales archaeon]
MSVISSPFFHSSFGLATPILKWAGGKTQIISELSRRFPKKLLSGEITSYLEPFIGGGAVFFYVMQHFSVRSAVISDLNSDLILLYKVVKSDFASLSDELASFKEQYQTLDADAREAWYYQKRDDFNRGEMSQTSRAAHLILLNRLCFNGLYRVNQNGMFNVPFGKYTSPRIYDLDNLAAVCSLLSGVTILHEDFEEMISYVRKDTFVYCDPPYRPLNRTSSFTQYSRDGFSDAEQIRLHSFFQRCDEIGAHIMLSNSDPTNLDPSDSFFDDLYAEYYIERVPAKRMINSAGNKRGFVNELIITNYETR